jgi:hypothetical protein
MHWPHHQNDEINIDKQHHYRHTNTNTPPDGTNVPDFDTASPGVLTHQYLQVVHGNSTGYNQQEIGYQKCSPTILVAQVGKSGIKAITYYGFELI